MTREASAATAAAAARLAPGVHVVPRDDDHVQVGLDPPARVIVRRDPDLLGLLDALRRGWPTPEPTASEAALLGALDEAGLLVVAGRQAPASGTVALVDLDLGLGPMADLLRRRGVTAATAAAPPDLYVVGSAGPVARADLDDWLSEGAPHLLLAGTGRPGSLRLGPLVEPGVTACQRCVDAAEADLDPRRTLVVEQLAALPTAPLDPALVAVGLAWAAREAAAYVAGGRPLTWSATVDLDGPAPVVRTWQRHPHCGCAWDVMPC
ncbi:hypothetical protein [Nocardioides sp.]|uniref:hypothetical protein n=1 Tax=Nocardioides sp. TaxID=35761 RepID=UPI0027281B1D|nr:hypothetical protein [Nocardioides sp.]MDO9458055.1 hypothetical protein [Nocardioides sp.]